MSDMLQAAYGSSTISFAAPAGCELLEKEAASAPVSAAEVMRALEEEAVLSEGLSNIIAQAQKILILLPDVTRASGAELFLADVLGKVEASGKPFSIMFAIGTHRKQTPEEDEQILTPALYARYKDRILVHDADDIQHLAFFGTTRAKTPILVNKSYLEHDTIIPIASVSYHYFAGFGGGRKMIIPGIAGRKTAMHNHKLVLDTRNRCKNPLAVTGNLKRNPVHDDIVEAVMITRARQTYFAINTLLDNHERIVGVTCGDLFMSHLKAADKLVENTLIEAEKPYDAAIISCGGFPHDINMVQAQKSLDRVAPIVKEGGKVIFLAECRDGYGNKDFEAFFDITDPEEMFELLVSDYRINKQTAYNIRLRTRALSVHLYSSLPAKDAERMGFHPVSSTDEIAGILAGAERVAFVPNAYIPLLRLKGE